jgi:hypothetical protein
VTAKPPAISREIAGGFALAQIGGVAILPGRMRH